MCFTMKTPEEQSSYIYDLGLLLTIRFNRAIVIFYLYALSCRRGPGGSISLVVGLPNNSYKPITNTVWVRARLCKLQKGCTRLVVASDKVYQLLAHGRWFSLGTPASSTTKTGRHDIAEILLKVALNTKKSK
jgi:hypothetical protein